MSNEKKVKKLFWRCEPSGGCVAVYSLSGELLRQVRLIEAMLYDLDEKEFDPAILKIDWYAENITIPDNESELALIMAQMDQDGQKLFRDAEDEIEKLIAFEKYFFSEHEKILVLQRK